ncbi:MAG: precorrin-6y C5,15-methyltransferase (decarboxylating) subunit CbiE [Oscillospiraceae bacterium]|nr:precorrin-6y C5,15-methyltransferase (decarboxylating) subunit CbiE [Oscillospiraceae bacterium]
MKVYLIGVGMGNPDTLTLGGKRAIEESELLIGAPRLLEDFEAPALGKLPLVRSAEIAEALHSSGAETAAVLLSGDVGFYSGAKNLYELLTDCEVETIPGISAVVYFCAKLRTTWQDAFLVSAHGRAHNGVGEIQRHAKTFLLTGGDTKAEDICKGLRDRSLDEVKITVGERLSYPDERIVTGTAAELAEQTFADLSVMLAENPRPLCWPFSGPGIPDEAFLRDKTPMTKEEVRALSISKLRLQPHHVLWDVGAGTGSVSVEGAFAVPAGLVFAVEHKPEAVELIFRNKEQFGVSNLQVIPGSAPEVLEALPPPDRVFVGGSSGRLEEILLAALCKNAKARVVVNAITLETVGEAVRCFTKLGLINVDIAQVNVAKARQAGAYHLMTAQNPVYVLSGEGRGAL